MGSIDDWTTTVSTLFATNPDKLKHLTGKYEFLKSKLAIAMRAQLNFIASLTSLFLSPR